VGQVPVVDKQTIIYFPPQKSSECFQPTPPPACMYLDPLRPTRARCPLAARAAARLQRVNAEVKPRGLRSEPDDNRLFLPAGDRGSQRWHTESAWEPTRPAIGKSNSDVHFQCSENSLQRDMCLVRLKWRIKWWGVITSEQRKFCLKCFGYLKWARSWGCNEWMMENFLSHHAERWCDGWIAMMWPINNEKLEVFSSSNVDDDVMGE
jgi:hypothetical protein